MHGDLPRVRPYTGIDLAQVLELDTSFEFDEFLRVDRDGDSFVLVTERLTTPGRKAYHLGEEVPSAEWDEAFVADIEGQVVGFAATQFAAWNRRQGIQHLYVAPPWRRQGVARALLERITERAIMNQASDVWLEVSNVNVPAIRAYRMLGFELTGLDAAFYDGTPDRGEVALLMSRQITASDR
jgi:ribosomal protein S18 acetylase RimI-like enzyme